MVSTKVLLFLIIAACLSLEFDCASVGGTYISLRNDADFQDEFQKVRNWRDELSRRAKASYESQLDEEDPRSIEEAEDYESLEDPRTIDEAEDEWLEDEEEQMDSTVAFNKEVEGKCAFVHNAYRKHYGYSTNVSSDANLVQYAKDLAENEVKNGKNGFGENLYHGKNFKDVKAALETAIKYWFLDICDIKRDENDKCVMKDSLAKMLWKGSKKIGCAVKKLGNGDYFVAVVYDKKPVSGEYHNNLPPCSTLISDKDAKKQECQKVIKDKFDEKVADTCVHIHNAYRKHYGYPTMVSSNAKLVVDAKRLAKTEVKNGKYGENLFKGETFGGVKDAIEAAIKDWFLEICDLGETCKVESNLAQMLWKGSKQIGCAIRESGNKYYVAVVYDKKPVDGQYADNLPSCKQLGDDKKGKSKDCQVRKAAQEKERQWEKDRLSFLAMFGNYFD